jgi:hypothetical protein
VLNTEHKIYKKPKKNQKFFFFEETFSSFNTAEKSRQELATSSLNILLPGRMSSDTEGAFSSAPPSQAARWLRTVLF